MNKQKVLEHVDMEAEYTLIYGNTNHFQGPVLATNGYGGSTIRAKQIRLFLQIGQLSLNYM